MGQSWTDMLMRWVTHRISLLAIFAVFLIWMLSSFSSSPLPPQPKATSQPHIDASARPNDRCATFPADSNITVIVKTGANEIYDKLPTQLLTMLECFPDLLIFSDLEQRLGPYPVYDVLDSVTASVKSNSDFDYYRTLQEYKKNNQDISTLRKTTGKAAWNLDKYKFLHMLEKTWEMRPYQKWYVFVEADTYLVRSNLLLWLARLDPSEALYMGSPTYVGGQAFAHGGSGIILSGAALAKFAEGDPGVAATYDVSLQEETFGDAVLMSALKDKGVELSVRWPMLQAEKPSTIPFGPGPDNGVRHWCQPIVTMHHIIPDETSRIWEFEQQRDNPTKPLLLKELYLDFVSPEIQAEREDWYNLSDDVMYRPPNIQGDRQKSAEIMTDLEKKAYMSFEDCGRACEEQSRCFQFAYSDDLCGFSYSYRLGRKGGEEDDRTYKSGWNLKKIAKDQAEWPCDEPLWL